MSSNQYPRKKIPVEVKDNDGGRFEYFSLGKTKSMNTPYFQRLTVFGRDECRAVINHMFDFVGPLNELAMRFYNRRDRRGEPLSPHPEEVAKLRAMLTDFMSLGIARYVATDGAYGNGLYYSLTEDGVKYYLEFLVEKAPKLYKETLIKFIATDKENEKYYFPILYLLMFLSENNNLDPLLTSVFSTDRQPSTVREVIESYLEYQITVKKEPEEKIQDIKYKEKVTRKLKAMIADRAIKIKNHDGIDYLILDVLGKKALSPIMEQLSKFINDIRQFSIVRIVKNENGVPVGFWLTHLGIALREAYLEKISEEIVSRQYNDDVLNPAMPIEEIPREQPQVFQLKLITGKTYTMAKRLGDRVKNIRLIPAFILIIATCLFSLVVGLLLANTSIIIGAIIAIIVALVLLLLIMGIEEARIRIKN